MSHVGVRIVANWFADATYGVNAIAMLIPRDGADPAPAAAHIYNETQHGWVARGQIPRPQSDIQYPAVLVFCQNGKFDSGVPDSQDTGARTIDGTVQLCVQLIMADTDTEKAVTSAMYLLRAIRNSLLQLNDPANDVARTMTGVRLEPAESVLQGQLDAPVGDNVVSMGALSVTYPVLEVTALT